MMFIALKLIYERRPADGTVFISYLLAFSGGSFFIDFFRGDLEAVFFGLRASQIISALIFAISLAVLTVRWKIIRSR